MTSKSSLAKPSGPDLVSLMSFLQYPGGGWPKGGCRVPATSSRVAEAWQIAFLMPSCRLTAQETR